MNRRTVDPNLEVLGANLLSLIRVADHESIGSFIKKHGLTNIDPQRWYPVKPVVDFIDDLEVQPNGMFDLVALGMKASQIIPLPPTVASLVDFAPVFGAFYASSYRNGDPGTVEGKVISDNHVRFTLNNIAFSPDFTYGALYGLAKRLLPKGTRITVRRGEHNNTITMDVTWEPVS